MFQITTSHRIFIAIQSIDFRRGIDGIVAICRQQLLQDPKSGHLFLFRNRRGNAVKLLAYDAQGFWLCHKRLSHGTFKCWPASPKAVLALTPAQLQVLLTNHQPAAITITPLRQVAPSAA